MAQSTRKDKKTEVPAPAGKVLYTGESDMKLNLQKGTVYSCIPKNIPEKLHALFVPVAKLGGKK